MHVIRPAAVCAFLINADQFFKNVTSQRSVIIRIKYFMLIQDILTNFSE